MLTLYEPFLALFVAGILIADLYGQIESSQSRDLAGAILCTVGFLLILLPETWFNPMYIGAAVCLTAGVAFFAPARRLFDNRLRPFSWLDLISALSGTGRDHLLIFSPWFRCSCFF